MQRNEYELRTRGFTYLRGTLPSDVVANLSAAVDMAIADDIARNGRDALLAMGQFGALRNLSALSRAFHPLIDHPPVGELVTALLGTDFVLHSFDALVLEPGEGRYPWDFHSDLSGLDGLAFPAGRAPAINCLYFIDEVHADNGATHLVPASHLSLLVDPPCQILADLAVAAEGRPGDALVFDARIWHCAGTNTERRSRRLIKTLFARPWMVQQMDYAGSLPADMAGGLGERRLRLLGRDARAPESIEALRNRLARNRPAGGQASAMAEIGVR